MKDVLFVVASKTVALHRKVIKTTLWAVQDKTSFDVISADDFAEKFGGMPPQDTLAKIRLQYKNICNMGTLSKREEKAYRDIMSPCIEIAQQNATTP